MADLATAAPGKSLWCSAWSDPGTVRADAAVARQGLSAVGGAQPRYSLWFQVGRSWAERCRNTYGGGRRRRILKIKQPQCRRLGTSRQISEERFSRAVVLGSCHLLPLQCARARSVREHARQRKHQGYRTKILDASSGDQS